MGMVGGKIAIITGATSGIGARPAELFVPSKVVFTGGRQAEGATVAARIGRKAKSFRPMQPAKRTGPIARRLATLPTSWSTVARSAAPCLPPTTKG